MTVNLQITRTKSCMVVACVAFSILASSVGVLSAVLPEQLESTIKTIESTVERGTNNIEASIESLLKSTVEELLGMDCPGVVYIVAADGCPTSSGSISVNTSTAGNNVKADSSNSKASQTETTRLASAPDDDMLTANLYVRSRDLANLDDQEYARENAAPFLGDAGRQQIKKGATETAEVLKSNLESAQGIQQLAESAQELTVTQDVMKSHAEMFSQLGDMAANQTRLSGQVNLGILSLQQQQAALMQLNANLSEGIDESNRRERLNQDVIAIEALRGSIYLPFRQAGRSERE